MISYTPKWYQELSIPQMNQIRTLSNVIKCDFDEKVTFRTRKTLTDIGIISSFVNVLSNDLKKIIKKSQADPGKFLCEIYRSITGNYFEEERNKKFYDCNERLILSAIAFLYLPETIIELHHRLPIAIPKKNNPSQKSFPNIILRQQSVKSPYLKSLFEEYNLIYHKNEELRSQNLNKLIAKPRIILPPSHLVLKSDEQKNSVQNNLNKKNSQINYRKTPSHSSKNVPKKNFLQLTSLVDNEINTELCEQDPNVEKLFIENGKFVNNENNKFLNESSEHENEKLANDDFIPSENFSINKTAHLREQEYLPRPWQEPFKNIDEDFVIMSKRANDILNHVYKTTRTLFNIDFCSECGIQNSNVLREKKETQNLLLDSLILDGNRKRKFIDSLTLNSPPQSLPLSETSLSQQQEITLSEDKLIKKNIICGSIIINGKTINQIGGILKDRLHISHKIPYLPKRIENILPCNCYCTEEEKKNEDDAVTHKLKCQQCCHNLNPILKNFILASEARENIEKQTNRPIDHTTCTQRFYIDKKKVILDKKPETCVKCINFPNKCKGNLFKDIKKFENKNLKEDEIKGYKDNIKFSICGIKQIGDDNAEGCQIIISNVALLTPTPITPDLSESDDTLNFSLSQYRASETKLNRVQNDNVGKLIGKRERTAKFIADSKNRVKDEIIALYKQVEELDNIRNKLNANLKTIQTDSPKIDLKRAVKKRSKKQIATMKNNSKPTKKVNALKKIIIDTNDTISNEKAVENDNTKTNNDSPIENINNKTIENFHQNTNKQIKNDENLLKNNNDLITMMKIALREMASENFLLAKLPDCDKIPQLRMWINYRRGFVTNVLEEELQDKVQNIGNEQFDDSSKITAPQIKLEKYQGTLNYSNINKIEHLIKLKKKIFYSKVRKSRVNKSRSAWNQLHVDNCLSNLLFKSTYFIYQPAKEADGYMLKPYGFRSSVKKNNKKSKADKK